MLDFLYNIIKYGVSVCIAGNTGSGKTSTASWLLSTIPNNKRIYTIEQGSREFDLVKHSEKDGSIVNSVIHTLTKSSNDPKNEITQQKLLDLALRFNPDVICVGEMRSDEAFAAQEAARTGHTVITTIHSKNAVGTYMRMTTLAKRAYEFTDETLMRLMIEAFPIIVYQHQMEDSSRKITEIIEGEGYKDGKVIYRTLFKYVVDDNIISNGKKTVLGHFENPNGISQELRDELMQNGMPKNIVDRFYKG
jgi:pilus assembly protein CpaF